MINYKLLFYLTAIFFISCNNAEKEPPKNEYEIRSEKQDKLDTLNQNEATDLSKRFSAITGEDSAIKFTYQIQEIVKQNFKPISIIGYIEDIAQLDSNYIVKIYGTFATHKCFGNVLISSEQFHQLNSQLSPKSLHNKGCFIFKPTSIKSSSMLTIDSEVSTDDDAETVEEANANASSELTYDFHKILFFIKGNMINFYVYKSLENEDE